MIPSSAMRSLRRSSIAIAALALALSFPTLAYAINLTSGGGFLFDLAETTTGTLGNGTVDAYDTCYYLDVGGVRYTAAGAAATTSLGGRQIEMAEVAVGALRAKRLVYVPASGGTYARFLDVISNPGASDVATTVRISGNLGSDTGTVVTATSSGDTAVTTADTWFATDDASDGAGDTSIAHVFQGGPGSFVTVSAASITTDSPSWQFDVTVPAGGRIAVMFFAVQATNRAASSAEAARVVALPAETLTGIEAYVGDIVNFPVGGAPVVRFTSPSEIDEGAEILIEAMVEDLEGDTPTWSWDLDGDGTFGELPDGTAHTIPAGTTDGNGSLTVAIEATDGTETRVVSRTIAIRNVPPAITSEPVTTGFVRREYVYDVVVEDPGGALDPLEFELPGAPSDMAITAAGRLTWTPPVSARGRTFPVTIRVLDGDGGEAVQELDIAVAENSPPGPPTPVAPIERAAVAAGVPTTLVVENAVDPDGDPLVYFFQVSRTSAFSGADLIGSGEYPEDPSGTTSWTTAAPLEPGLWYWRAWVGDGIEESTRRNATFVVREEVADAGAPDGGVGRADAGPPETPRSGGCSCSTSGASGRGAGGLAVLALALVGLRRRIRLGGRS